MMDEERVSSGVSAIAGPSEPVDTLTDLLRNQYNKNATVPRYAGHG